MHKAFQDNPDTPLLQLEKQTLGVDHCQIGDWLATAWNFPDALQFCISNHHQLDTTNRKMVYANLAYLANVLLKSENIGDADGVEIPSILLDRLGLTQDQTEAMLEKILNGREDLEHMANQLAA